LEEAATIGPMLDVNGVVAAAYEPRSGYADPYAVTTTYARAARELGATVQMQVEAVSLQMDNGKVTGVVTDHGIVETDTVVVAAGPWAPKLLGPIGFDIPLEPVRHQVVQIQRPWDILPHHPAVADIANKASFRPDGDQFTLIGVGEDETVDADSFNPAVDFEPAAQAFERVVQRMPALGQGYFRGGWAGLFTVTPDWHPVLDRVEGAEGVYCAVGFSGHGFKLAPMIGTVMAELVTEGQAASVDITPLRVSRFREGDLVRSSYRYSVLA
jgi:glycine/D-amino acid oxidase-like deaminating enzyme